MNFKKFSNNNTSGSKSMIDVASSIGTKIITSNPFDLFNMVEKDIGVATSDSINSKGDNLNIGNNKHGNLNNVDNDSENDMEEDDNETTSFMASKSSKGTISSKRKGEMEKKSLYERWKHNYNDNIYDNDDEHEELMDEQLVFVTLLTFRGLIDVSYI
uniref:Uncharacterized protein n=1 Tax=Tanacetum cinerariifolium TaxID=118510 RepID=A0A6L2KJC5_TANCI|nr:hypothetical protein [Tanacetum cinerariifolium]